MRTKNASEVPEMAIAAHCSAGVAVAIAYIFSRHFGNICSLIWLAMNKYAWLNSFLSEENVRTKQIVL
ncbi:hypothetical protein [Microcoleus sp. herbarium12]|uniref:hypothetical protein n=1 Tax=Microcoleus sp. herbarium12 TaxID=3055437 RepID=UPI002FD3B3AE